MPLVTSPLFYPNSQYRPNIFVVSMTSADPLVLAQASIVVDLVGVTSMTKAPFLVIGTTYYFEFDVSKVLQTASAPKAQQKTSIFPDSLNVPYNQQNTDCHTSVALVVSYYYNASVTGTLTQHPTIDTIPNGYYATNGTRQTRNYSSTNGMGLENYVMDLAYAASNQRQFLTNRPQPFVVCKTKDWNENLYLSFIPDLCNSFRVTTYDEDGIMLQQGLASITPDSTFIPTTIGVAPANLQTQTYFSGAVTFVPDNIDTYTIEVGNSYLFGMVWTFIPVSQTQTYKIKRDCCGEKLVRLHWMNRLGGIDAYTFGTGKKIVQKTKGNTAQKPQTFGYSLQPTTAYDRGSFKFNQQTIHVWEVTSSFYDHEMGEYLSELISSPEVYLEEGGESQLISVVVDDADITISESDELVNVTIRFIEANQISTQQN